MTNIEHLIELTRQALDEFESVPLPASLRRAQRIARLRGDTHWAQIFHFDLSPHGGSQAWRRTEAYEMFKAEQIDGIDVDQFRSQILEEWMKERTPSRVEAPLQDAFGQGQLVGGSIDSVIRRAAGLELLATTEVEPMPKYRLELRRELDLEMIERTTHRAFDYLCTVERELSYIGVNSDIFERHRRRVESFLSRIAPAVLDQFTAAYRRARDDDAESKTHALTTCRRILEAVADIVYPPRTEKVEDSRGNLRNVGATAYINRLWIFTETVLCGNTHSEILLATLGDFGARIDKVYAMTNKGVHAEVTQAEVDTCVMQTYVLAGEILRVYEESTKADASESLVVEPSHTSPTQSQ